MEEEADAEEAEPCLPVAAEVEERWPLAWVAEEARATSSKVTDRETPWPWPPVPTPLERWVVLTYQCELKDTFVENRFRLHSHFNLDGMGLGYC